MTQSLHTLARAYFDVYMLRSVRMLSRLQMMFILMRNRNIFHMILVWTYRQIYREIYVDI